MIHIIIHYDTGQVEVALVNPCEPCESFFINTINLIPDTELYNHYRMFRRFRSTGRVSHIEIPVTTESVRVFWELRGLNAEVRGVEMAASGRINVKTISEGSVLA